MGSVTGARDSTADPINTSAFESTHSNRIWRISTFDKA